jgi:hypothetical protein
MGPLLDEVGPVDADAAEAVLKQLQSAILKGLDCVSHSDLTGLIAAANEMTSSTVAFHLLSL